METDNMEVHKKEDNPHTANMEDTEVTVHKQDNIDTPPNPYSFHYNSFYLDVCHVQTHWDHT